MTIAQHPAGKQSQLDVLNREIVGCRKCPRLVAWRETVAREKRFAYRDQEYWGRPVPGFGDPEARVLVVGLAPGAHGSNRTGRQFTGDGSGAFLFPALHHAGFANQARAESRHDGLVLKDMYITASARCAPPANHPTSQELANCQPYLELELRLLHPCIIVCLGRVAFERILRIFSLREADFKFRHRASYRLPNGITLIGSYHPSRQNTSTGRLTAAMFDGIWSDVRALLDASR